MSTLIQWTVSAVTAQRSNTQRPTVELTAWFTIPDLLWMSNDKIISSVILLIRSNCSYTANQLVYYRLIMFARTHVSSWNHGKLSVHVIE